MNFKFLILIEAIAASRIWGNIYTDQYLLTHLAVVPAATLTQNSESCIYAEHSAFFTGSKLLSRLVLLYKRTKNNYIRRYDELITEISWMSTDGSQVEIEVIHFDEKLKNSGAEIWKYPGNYTESASSEGNITLGLQPISFVDENGLQGLLLYTNSALIVYHSESGCCNQSLFEK